MPPHVKAQYDDDHLEPVDLYFNLSESDLEYAKNMREILFEKLEDKPEIRILVLPSFHPEYVLDIVEEKDPEEKVLYLNMAKDFIYDAESGEDLEKISLYKFRVQIDKESFDLIYKLIQTAIYQARYNKPERSLIRVDGTNYYFSIYDDGLKSGTVWSPSEESKMGRLVDVSQHLVKLTIESNGTLKINEELQTKIELLIDDLNDK